MITSNIGYYLLLALNRYLVKRKSLKYELPSVERVHTYTLITTSTTEQLYVSLVNTPSSTDRQ